MQKSLWVILIFLLVIILGCSHEDETTIANTTQPQIESLPELEQRCAKSEIINALNQFIGGGKSLNEIEAWLNDQRCMVKTELSMATIETIPIQREIRIIYRSTEDMQIEAVLDLIEVTGTDTWKFGRIHS